MPLFISQEELSRHSGDASFVADKADSYIRDLLLQLETAKAKCEASAITAEQRCSLLEQKYIALTSDLASLQNQNASLTSSLEQRNSEIAAAQAEKHQIHLKAIGKDGDMERLSVELTELHSSKRQLLELLEQKDAEISEKNALIQSYLDKIVKLTEDTALKTSKLHDNEAELTSLRSSCGRLSQEKELIERHNTWLNGELTVKVNNILELRRAQNEFEADITGRLSDVERQFNECSSSLKWHKERTKELEDKLTCVQEELCASQVAAASGEEQLSSELATVSKLAELYKESSEEWSRKAGDLEGVVKAVEKHLSQVENDYKEKLEKETSLRQNAEQEAANLKEKLEKCLTDVENERKTSEMSIFQFSRATSEDSDRDKDPMTPFSKLPVGISGTALAASLLRDGWSLATMYEKYQEAVDALRHERLGRQHSQALLERVLYEIEERAAIVSDERAEHERMMQAYSLLDEKLQKSLSERSLLEHTVRELKAELRISERNKKISHKEIEDLEKQVTILLKECRDVQLRCGGSGPHSASISDGAATEKVDSASETEEIISELLTFKDINGLVEQNVQLRSIVRTLSDEHEHKNAELQEQFQNQLHKHNDETAEKVLAVVKRSEEQGHMIEALHNSVAMYKRLYEEQLKHHSSVSHGSIPHPENGKSDLLLLVEGSYDTTKRAYEQAVERARSLEEELAAARNLLSLLRVERDKLVMEANFARERMERFVKDTEQQRQEINGVLARNVEFSKLIVDYQKRLRDVDVSLLSCQEVSQKLSAENSLLKHEKEVLVDSEKRAFDEVRDLTERIHRLQASLEAIQSAEEIRGEARVFDRKKQEEYVEKIEREWAETKKELQDERDRVRVLTLDKNETLKDAMRQVEEFRRELADAFRAVSSAEARATTAEARCFELESSIRSLETKDREFAGGGTQNPTREATEILRKAEEEIETLKEESKASRDHMLQFKEIARVNEVALKQIEAAHESYKAEAEKQKLSQESEILRLSDRVSDLEVTIVSKTVEATAISVQKEEAFSCALSEINHLKEDNAQKMSELMELELKIASLKEDLEEQHRRWRTTQDNYERQVILQAETIRELTQTSEALAMSREELSKLQHLADAQKCEIDVLKAGFEREKSVLEKLKDEALKKYDELNEQNKILHHRLEAVHLKLDEKDNLSMGNAFEILRQKSGDNDLQSVICYLRRSREIAETEVSLLKQEKLRLQSQLDSALKAADSAQSLLTSERANIRATLFTEEEFKSLKFQVGELNLLRESNKQLREENKHNFEECQKYQEIAQRAEDEKGCLISMVHEKEIELGACKNEMAAQKSDLERRIFEVTERMKIRDMDYEQVKENHQAVEKIMRERETELDEARKLINEKQELVARLEHEIADRKAATDDLKSRLNHMLESEAALVANADKQKRMCANLKRQINSLVAEKDRMVKEKEGQVENLIKEKNILSKQLEEMAMEKQTFAKQIEDLRSGKKIVGDMSNDHAMKEKDTRMQMLERTLEREKARRLRTEKLVEDLASNVRQEKQKLTDELMKHKLAREALLESGGFLASQLPSESALDDQAAAYLSAADNLEREVQLALIESTGASPGPGETSDMSSWPNGKQASEIAVIPTCMTAITTSPSLAKPVEERERKTLLLKPNTEVRKAGRRLVRPQLERAPEPSVELSDIEGHVTIETTKPCASQVPEFPGDATELSHLLPARKRPAPPSTCELQEEAPIQQNNSSDVAHLPKKVKGAVSAMDVTSEEPASDAAARSPITEGLHDRTDDVAHISNEVTAEEVGSVLSVEELKETVDGDIGVPSELMEDRVPEKIVEEEVALDESTLVTLAHELQRSPAEESEKEEGEFLDEVDVQIEGADVNISDIPVVDSHAETFFDEESCKVERAIHEEGNLSGEPADEVSEGASVSLITLECSASNSEFQPSIQAPFNGADGSSVENVPFKPVGGSPTHETGDEKEMPAGGRLVNLEERARENAALRRAGMLAPTPASSRGRAVGFYKREMRGRGTRGGQGQASQDKEPS